LIFREREHRGLLRRRRQLPNRRRDIRLRSKARHELLHLALAPARGRFDELGDVALREVVAKEDDAGEMESSRSDRIEQRRKALDESRCGESTERFALAEPALPRAEVEHRGAGEVEMDASALDFGEVADDLRDESMPFRDERFQGREDRFVRELGDVHSAVYQAKFRGPPWPPASAIAGTPTSKVLFVARVR
jgi:hypothetical protein